MPWGRLDDALHQNAKVLSFSDKAFRLWVYSISYCNAKRFADPVGTLTESAAQALCRLAQARPATVAELVAKHGWELAVDGYVVHDFPDYGPPADRTAAERQRRHRGKVRDAERNGHSDVTRDGHAPVPIPEPMSHVPVPDPAHASTPSSPAGEEEELVAGRRGGTGGSTGPVSDREDTAPKTGTSWLDAVRSQPRAPAWSDGMRRGRPASDRTGEAARAWDAS